MHSFKSPFLFKINYFENDKWNIRNSEEIDPNKPKYFENDRWNSEEVNSNKANYFLIAISIISLSLIYYYWDSISDLTSNLFKNTKPDIDPSSSTSEIQLIDNTNLETVIENFPDSFEQYCSRLNNSTEDIVKIIKRTRDYLLLIKDLSPEQQTAKISKLIGLYEQLKLKQNEYVDLFNGLNDKLSYGDQTRLLGNIDAIKDVLFKYSDLIPENMVNLSDIHKIKLNNILERSVSPILVESAAEVENLNTKIERSWSDPSSSSSSPASEDTIKGSTFKPGFLKGKDIDQK